MTEKGMVERRAYRNKKIKFSKLFWYFVESCIKTADNVLVRSSESQGGIPHPILALALSE